MVASLIVTGFSPVGAQTIVTDEDSLFGSGALVAGDDGPSGATAIEADATPSAVDEDGLFAADVLDIVVDHNAAAEDTTILAGPLPPTVELGGSYRFSLGGSATWQPIGELTSNLTNPDQSAFGSELGATLFFDARPDGIRVFGKADLSHPFTSDTSASPPRSFDDVLRVVELFSDFSVGDRFFFRGGKQTISWGVGVFFSPADVLNLSAIDPDDPDADREGPVSLRLNVPVSVHNLYLYLLADPMDGATRPGLAPKAELVVRRTELGIGGYYHPDRVPRAMVTVSSSLLDFALFGEAEASWGSDRTFVEEIAIDPENPFGLHAAARTDEPFAALTGGVRYTYTPDTDRWSAGVIGQYLWNGEGYADAELLRGNAAGVAALIAAGELCTDDLMFPGRHYGALSLSLSLGRGRDWSLSNLWYANLSDGSGRVSTTVSWQLADGVSLSSTGAVSYGVAGSELTPVGDGITASLRASLGSGRF